MKKIQQSHNSKGDGNNQLIHRLPGRINVYSSSFIFAYLSPVACWTYRRSTSTVWFSLVTNSALFIQFPLIALIMFVYSNFFIHVRTSLLTDAHTIQSDMQCMYQFEVLYMTHRHMNMSHASVWDWSINRENMHLLMSCLQYNTNSQVFRPVINKII